MKFTSSWDLGCHWQFDTIVRYVDTLPGEVIYGQLIPEVPNYITMDLRLAWQPNKHVMFEVIGRNLLDYHHEEIFEQMARTPPPRWNEASLVE